MHGPVGGLANERGLHRGIGLGVLVVDVADALLGHLGRFGRQPFGLLDRTAEMIGLGAPDPIEGGAFRCQFRIGRRIGVGARQRC